MKIEKQTVSFNYSDLMQDIMDELEYLAGRSGGDEEKFYRLRVCTADRKMILALIERSLAETSVAMAAVRAVFSLKEGSIEFVWHMRRGIEASEAAAYGELIYCMVKARVIYLWLKLIGEETAVGWQETYESALRQLLQGATAGCRLYAYSRRVPPI